MQGDLREQAQHIRVTCKYHPSVVEDLLVRAESLSLLSTPDNIESDGSSNQSLSSHSPKIKRNKAKELIPMSNNRKDGSKLKQGSSVSVATTTQLLPSKRSSGRPLPKPLVGTEKLNASYTNAFESSRNELNQRYSPRILSPSKSMTSLSDNCDVIILHKAIKAPLFRKRSFLSSSLSSSWNDILRADQINMSKKDVLPRNSIACVESSPDNFSRSLSQSVSSKIFKLVKSRENVSTDTISYTETSTPSASTSSQDDNADYLDEEYHVEIFTISKTSKLFNVLHESWIFSLIVSYLTIWQFDILLLNYFFLSFGYLHFFLYRQCQI